MTSNTAIAASRSNYNGYNAMRPAVLGLAKLLFLGLCQIPFVSAMPLHHHGRLAKLLNRAKGDLPKDSHDPSLWLYLSVAAVLVLLGGAFAGLTIALMGQDGVYLQVIATSGEGKEQRHAQKVFNLLQKGKHWVLVTLLLSNVIVNESLPIVLDRSLGGGWPAVLGSTVLIVIFGEVIPQSVCVRYGLSIGAYMTPFVLGLMWLLSPIAWPTAKLLDKLLGEDHGTVYKKSGLKTLVTLHKTLGASPTERLNQDEVTIISAVLDLKDKAVGDIMTPIDDVFTMSSETVLDEEMMNTILSAGYSRIPIYEPGNPQNFIGMLLVKILITYDPEDSKKVSEFALATLPETRPETSCLDIVNFFQEGKSHMVMVSDYPGENYGAIGVVTLEDVIEELIGEEIIDESDVYIDVHKAIRRIAPAPKARVQKGHIVEHPEIIPAYPQEDLIDFNDERRRSLDDIATKNMANGGGRGESPATFGTSPKATFFKRTPSGGDGSITVRGNVTEMREHLKHLGPSNLASRPKSTRYQSVKIKPGHAPPRSDSRADSTLHRDSIVEEIYQDHPSAPRGGEGEGLLGAGGLEAKDGIQALQQGYGTLNRTFSKKGSEQSQLEAQHDGSSRKTPASLSILRDGKRSESPRSNISRQESQHSDKSTDTLGSMQSSSNSPARRRGAARSGSITENVVEAGGVRKVVLQTNSFSEDQTGGKYTKPTPAGTATTYTALDGNGNEDSHDEHSDRPASPKKKRRRQRKKKGGKSGEDGGGT